MSRRPVIAILAAVFVAGLAAAASAATQEYHITVPLTLKGLPAIGTNRSITVSCAVGPASMSYSTGTGDATGSTGTGSTQAKLPLSQPGGMSQDVVVIVTDSQTTTATGRGTGVGATTYLCWGKYSPSSTATPVNFITGLLH
jgi:hypothetical protein